MPVLIALYRGINVLGKNSVKMELLRAMHERLGHSAVTSYIQSGNIVFSARASADAIARRTAAEFLKEFGFPAKLMVVEASKLGEIVKANPFTKFSAQNHKVVHVGICQGQPDARQLKSLLIKTGGTEAFVTGSGILYLHTPDGFGKSKFAAA